MSAEFQERYVICYYSCRRAVRKSFILPPYIFEYNTENDIVPLLLSIVVKNYMEYLQMEITLVMGERENQFSYVIKDAAMYLFLFKCV